MKLLAKVKRIETLANKVFEELRGKPMPQSRYGAKLTKQAAKLLREAVECENG